ncbi:MAG: hypothetical protein WC655_23240 [Candidatus Hydrogenedentales bacterium]
MSQRTTHCKLVSCRPMMAQTVLNLKLDNYITNLTNILNTFNDSWVGVAGNIVDFVGTLSESLPYKQVSG